MSPGSRLDDGQPWMVGLIFGTASGWAGATRGKNKVFSEMPFYVRLFHCCQQILFL